MRRQNQILKIVTDELTKYGISYQTGFTGSNHQRITWLNATGIRRMIVTSTSPGRFCIDRIRADVRRVLRQDGVIT